MHNETNDIGISKFKSYFFWSWFTCSSSLLGVRKCICLISILCIFYTVSIGLWKKFSEIFIEIQYLSFTKKIVCKMAAISPRPQCINWQCFALQRYSGGLLVCAKTAYGILMTATALAQIRHYAITIYIYIMTIQCHRHPLDKRTHHVITITCTLFEEGRGVNNPSVPLCSSNACIYVYMRIKSVCIWPPHFNKYYLALLPTLQKKD